MAVPTYTKSGGKAATPAKLDKAVFAVDVKDHQLLKDAYLAHLANGRTNNAVSKQRGEVRGGGRKPWRQKGTGNARVGSIRTPLWRGGGVIFGPTGRENYSRKLNAAAKRQALRQALSLAAKADKVAVIESLAFDGKTKSAVKVLDKLESGRKLLVAAAKEEKVVRSARNLADAKLTTAAYLNVYDILSSDIVVIEKAAVEQINQKLKEAK